MACIEMDSHPQWNFLLFSPTPATLQPLFMVKDDEGILEETSFDFRDLGEGNAQCLLLI